MSPLAAELLAAIAATQADRSRARSAPRPIVVALDGRSGSGKSTLAAETAAALGACTVIEGDEFYAGGPEERWDAMTPAEKVAWCIDWTRQRPVLEALRDGRTARWHSYDWDAFDGRLAAEPTTAQPAPVVILEGAYSARPELADLLDLRVLLETDKQLRLQRLRQRDGTDWHDEWAQRWSEAEDHYYSVVMTPEAFDLVLVTRSDH